MTDRIAAQYVKPGCSVLFEIREGWSAPDPWRLLARVIWEVWHAGNAEAERALDDALSEMGLTARLDRAPL